MLKATIDNGGDFEEQESSEYETYPPIQNVPDKYWNMAKEGMRLVNHGPKGTARRSFYNMDYQTGGKSGTAQVFGLAEDEEYNADEVAEHLRDHALFTGFAPFDDPKVVVSVVLENAGGGSSNGAPVVRKIFDRVILGPEKIESDEEQNNAKKEVAQ